MTERSDEELMEMIAQQDRAAFTTLVDRHIDTLYNYAFRLTNSRSRSDDLVQELWLTVWQKASTYRARRARVTTWLHTLLRNKYIDTHRKFWRETDSDALTEPAHSTTIEGHLGLEQDRQTINQAIDELPENQRSAIVLTYSKNFSNKEVAHILGLNLRACESLLARAKQTLKTKLASQWSANE